MPAVRPCGYPTVSDTVKAFILVVVSLTGIIIGIVAMTSVIYNDRMARGAAYYLPACPEDAVLVGTGSFENGRWTDYECGPAVDDYQP